MMDRLYSQGDNLNHNFCRTADPKDTRPWCYTTNPYVRFDYCDCSKRTAMTTTTTATTTTMTDYDDYDDYNDYDDYIPMTGRGQ